MNIESTYEYKFIANQKVRVTKGYFKGIEETIVGFKVKRNQWWNPWSATTEAYRLSIRDYGYRYFLAEALEAVE